MNRFGALALGIALLGASDDPNTVARYFVGSWKCAGASLTFAPFAETNVWMRLSYGSGMPEGNAIVGYVASLHAWVFRDFHSNGAYADLSSPGPSDGRWQWTGPYYPQEGGPPLQGRMTYLQISATRFDRTFELLRDQDYVRTGNDSCMRVNS